MAEARSRTASRRVLLASLWVMLVVLMLKVWLGLTAQSLGLLAEALHTLVLVFSLFLATIAVSSRYSNGRDAGGHSPFEAALALLLVGLIGFFSLNLFLGVGRYFAARSLPDAAQWIAQQPSLLQLVAVMVAISFCLACFQRYQGNVLQSTLLRVIASGLFQDTWLTGLVLVALVVGRWGFGWLDPLLAIGLVISAILTCWRMLSRQLPLLIKPIAIAPEALAQTIHQVEGITHCYDIRSRGVVGRQIFVEMRLILHPECVGVARTIAERVERAIRERYGPARVVIYIDTDVTGATGQRQQA